MNPKTEEISNFIESKYAATNRKYQKENINFAQTDSFWQSKPYNYNKDEFSYNKELDLEKSKKYEKS